MGKDKGGSFEREESRFISLWWTDRERDDVFWRNRTRITSKAVNAERQLGDLTATHTIGLPLVEVFNVEFKRGYSKKKTDATKKKIAEGKAVKPQTVRNTPWDLLEIIDSKVIDDNLVILNFWQQCLSDAIKSGRIPVLIFKRDFHDAVVAIDVTNFGRFIDLLGYPPSRSLSFTDRENAFRLSFYRHQDFFDWLTPTAVRLFHSKEIAHV
jgi:hypothetical protein